MGEDGTGGTGGGDGQFKSMFDSGLERFGGVAGRFPR